MFKDAKDIESLFAMVSRAVSRMSNHKSSAESAIAAGCIVSAIDKLADAFIYLNEKDTALALELDRLGMYEIYKNVVKDVQEADKSRRGQGDY